MDTVEEKISTWLDQEEVLSDEAFSTIGKDAGKAIQMYLKIIKENDDYLAYTLPIEQVAVEGGDAPASVGEDQSMQVTGKLAEALFKVHEQTMYCIAQLYVKTNQASCLRDMLIEYRSFLSRLPKVRTAKIVRTLIDLLARIPGSSQMQEGVCEECIRWCLAEKRTFLRLRVQTRLALLHLQEGKPQVGLALVETLLREVKKLDDKMLLVEIHLIESRLYFLIKNIARSKAALTAARTTANSIHCPPLLQGDIDLQAGILHAEERDFKTSFSYFFEAHEAFSTITPVSFGLPTRVKLPEDPRALQALKYMILSKIICGQPDEVTSIMSGKQGLKYHGNIELESLKAVAKCHKSRSLRMFQDVLEEYRESFLADVFLQSHINDLNETLLEQNLQRILEPFSRVEISHIARLIELPLEKVQSKLEEMILDNKLRGTLDQGIGVLLLFDDLPLPSFYEDVLATIRNMSDTVDVLHEKVREVPKASVKA